MWDNVHSRRRGQRSLVSVLSFIISIVMSPVSPFFAITVAMDDTMDFFWWNSREDRDGHSVEFVPTLEVSSRRRRRHADITRESDASSYWYSCNSWYCRDRYWYMNWYPARSWRRRTRDHPRMPRMHQWTASKHRWTKWTMWSRRTRMSSHPW